MSLKDNNIIVYLNYTSLCTLKVDKKIQLLKQGFTHLDKLKFIVLAYTNMQRQGHKLIGF